MADDEKTLINLEQFAQILKKARAGEGTPDVDLSGYHIRAPFTAEVEPGDEDERIVTFVVATDKRNRNGWRLNPDGWLLENYERNPVVLWAHDENSLPVGRGLEVWSEANKLKAKVQFTPPGMSRFNDTVYSMVKGGFLNAVSAGFGVNEWEWVEDAEGRYQLDFLEQELWEISIVPVPAEPNALKIAAGAGIDITPLRRWARQLLDEPRFIMRVPHCANANTVAKFREAFADFYPSAKLLILEEGFELHPFDAEFGPAPPRPLEQQDIGLPGETTTTNQPVIDTGGSEPSGDEPAEGASAPADDPAAEGSFRGSRESRIRDLELLDL